MYKFHWKKPAVLAVILAAGLAAAACGSATGASVTIGSGQLIEGFESGLVGAKKGDEVELSLSFPADYRATELAGKPVVFKVKVNSITRPRLLNDALAAEIDSSVKTADEYRAKVQAQLQQNADYSYDQTLAYDAVQTVVQNSEVEPSDEAVAWKTDDLIKNYYEPMTKRQYGMELADLLSMQGQSLAQFREGLAETARQTVQQIMVMEAIEAEENLQVTEADREKFATDNGTTLEALRSGASDEDIDEAVLQQLATDVIIDNATIVSGGPDETAAAEAASTAASTAAAEE